MSTKLISIIGPPAAGKTTLAELLAQALPAELIREDYAGNPFLASSYLGDDRARLPGQLYFLLSRAKQLATPAMPANGFAVSDYGFCQDSLYARLRLNPADLETYWDIADRVAGIVHSPDLLIRLDASVESLLQRIAERGRSYESALTAELLTSIRRQYESLPAEAECPVIRVDTDRVDIRDSDHCHQIIEQLRDKL